MTGKSVVSKRGRTLAVLAAIWFLGGCGDTPDKMVASAKGYLEQGDYNAAGIQLKNALQQDSKLAEARYLLGKVNLQQGNLAGAEKELRRASELGFAQAQVAPMLARTLVQMGEFERVVKDFTGVSVGEDVANAQILAAIGDAHFARGEFDKARRAFEEALGGSGTEPTALLGRARVHLVAGELDAATSDTDAVLGTPAGGGVAAEAHALKADIWLARKKPDEAAEALEAAIKARPDVIGYRFALVNLLLQSGKIDEAATRVTDMTKVAEKHPLTQYLQALVAVRRGRLAEAKPFIDETVRLLPDYLPGRLLAGSIYAGLREHTVAQEHLSRVVARAPRHDGARRMLALSLLESGAPKQAMETLEPLLDAPKPAVETLRVAGRIHAALGEAKEAAEVFEKVVASNPNDAAARTQLGISRLLAGRGDAGVDDLESASELSSSEGEADLALIMVQARRGKLDEAMAAAQALERKRPQDPQTYVLKGGLLLAKRDVPGARAALGKALELNPAYLPAAIGLARLDVAEKHPDDARKRFESVIQTAPSNVDAYLLLGGMILSTGGKPDEARTVLDRAVKTNPQAVAARLAIVTHELRFGDPKKAVTLAQEVVAAHPGDARVHRILGRAFIAAGDPAQAVAAFTKELSLAPRAVVPLLELAEAQRLNKDIGAAEQTLRKALTIKPDMLDAQLRLSGLLAATQRGDEALKVAKTVQQQRPRAAAGWSLEGEIHAGAKSWAPAQQAFRKALELQKSPQTVIRLHAALKAGGKGGEASKVATDWIKAVPDDLLVRNYLAELALVEQRLDEAERIYREMNKIRADNPIVVNNLAWIAGQRGDAGALALAERAYELAPQNPAVLDTLGSLQVAGGQTEKGLDNLRKAVSLAPDQPRLRENLAKVYVQLGRKDEARKELDAALSRVPEGAPQRKAIMELKDKL